MAEPSRTMNVLDVADEVVEEVRRAEACWPPFNSAHEGYGVIMEELRELEAHIFTNQKRRDLEAMRKEAIQLAAMAIRFVLNISDGERGRK